MRMTVANTGPAFQQGLSRARTYTGGKKRAIVIVQRNSDASEYIEMELEYVTDMSGYRPPQSLNEPKLQSATVLVVEDEADSREVFTHYLVWRGYRVFAVADSKDALDTLECEPSIGIVLLDLMMPGTGGLETMKAILERRPEVGVIMMSALYDNEVAALAVNRGAYDYLLKPFPLDLLDEVITACLTNNESRKRPWWRRIG